MTSASPSPDLPRRPPAGFYDQEDSTNVCLRCGDARYELHMEVSHFGFPFRFSRCRCGMIKQIPVPNEKFFEWFFNSPLFLSAKEDRSCEIWGYYDYFKDEWSRLVTSRYRYWRLRSVFETGERLRIMKIGPSTGTMLHVAQQHGHTAIGSDVSSRFVEYAREHYGVRIDHGRFERLNYQDAAFDVIMLFNVIENVNNLSEFLRSIHRRLKPGGTFILNYVEMEGNLVARIQKDKYFLYRPPVCYIFEGPVLQRLLAQHGFEVRNRIRDVRFMHLEKIFTLLRWSLPLSIARALRVHRLPFPVYAYPSRILVMTKRSG